MNNNDHALQEFATDKASNQWLPAIHVPLGCVISSDIGDFYDIPSETSNRTLKRFIGQYWTVELQPRIGEIRIFPHELVPTLTTPDHDAVLGRSYMSNGSVTQAQISQFEPCEEVKLARKIQVVDSLMVTTCSTTPMQRSTNINNTPQSVHESRATSDNRAIQSMDSPVTNRTLQLMNSPFTTKNDSHIQPGSVRRTTTEVGGFIHGGLDATDAQQQLTAWKDTATVQTQGHCAGNLEYNTRMYGPVAAKMIEN